MIIVLTTWLTNSTKVCPAKTTFINQPVENVAPCIPFRHFEGKRGLLVWVSLFPVSSIYALLTHKVSQIDAHILYHRQKLSWLLILSQYIWHTHTQLHLHTVPDRKIIPKHRKSSASFVVLSPKYLLHPHLYIEGNHTLMVPVKLTWTNHELQFVLLRYHFTNFNTELHTVSSKTSTAIGSSNSGHWRMPRLKCGALGTILSQWI